MFRVRRGLVIASELSRRGQGRAEGLGVVDGDLVLLPVLHAAWAVASGGAPKCRSRF